MIQLTCTSCQKLLQIDDAFAGGVCRCKFCGTIQTVPSAQKKAAAAAPTRAQSTPKAIYQNPARPESSAPASAELADLAQAVSTSGLSGTGLRDVRLRQPQAGPKSASKMPLIIGASAAIAVIIGVCAWLFLHKSGGKSDGVDNPNPSSNGGITDPKVKSQGDNAVAISDGPRVMGVALKGPTVVYLLDRGSGTTETFDSIKAGTLKSLATLGPEIRFQVIFWETETMLEYPIGGLRYATKDNIENCTKAFADVFAWGQSKIEKPLERALAQGPAEIVLISGKNGLDDDFVKAVLDTRKDSAIPIHAFSIGRNGSPDALKTIAQKTGGQFREVTGTALRELVE